jgi:hypothetical protein
MSKDDEGNGLPEMFDHLRMLNELIPANQGILFRWLVTARLECNRANGEVFGRAKLGLSPRGWLQACAKIGRLNSFKKASAQAVKLGLVKNERVYKGGERQKGGDRVILNAARWNELTQIHMSRREDLLSGVQKMGNYGPLVPISASQHSDAETASQRGAETASQRGAETASQHNKDSGYSNGYRNGDAPDNGGGMYNHLQLPSAEFPLTSKTKVGGELQMQQISDISFTDNVNRYPPDGFYIGNAFHPRLKADAKKGAYLDAAWADPDTGKVWLVDNDAGNKLYRSLRDEYSIETMKAGLRRAASKGREKQRRKELPGWIRACCGWAAEDAAKAVKQAQGRSRAFQA